MNELTIGDKVYISSKRAAEITGYAKDYVGQLCREGRVEATLVGRNWYVLESSIRAHRFGADESAVDSSEDEVADKKLPTWNPPKYVSEEAPPIPTLERKGINLLADDQQEEQRIATQKDEPKVEIDPVSTSVEDMQAAWKEWFATRQQAADDAVSSSVVAGEEVLPAQETFEEPVLVRKVEESVTGAIAEEKEYDPVPYTRQIEEEVTVHRAHDVMAPGPQLRIVGEPRRPSLSRAANHGARKRKSAGESSLALKSAFIAVALFAVAVTFIGTGMADMYVKNSGFESTMLRFFSGTSIVDK